MGDTVTVKLGARSFDLRPPASYTTRHEVLAASASGNIQRVAAASLGLCCPQVERMLREEGKPPLTYQGCGFSALAYGGEVMDRLLAKGVSLADVLAAGVEAFNLIADSLVTNEEIEEAEGNSEAPTGG